MDGSYHRQRIHHMTTYRETYPVFIHSFTIYCKLVLFTSNYYYMNYNTNVYTFVRYTKITQNRHTITNVLSHLYKTYFICGTLDSLHLPLCRQTNRINPMNKYCCMLPTFMCAAHIIQAVCVLQVFICRVVVTTPVRFGNKEVPGLWHSVLSYEKGDHTCIYCNVYVISIAHYQCLLETSYYLS